VVDVVNNNLSTAFNSFFDAVAEGTLTLDSFKAGFRDFIKSTLDGVRKAVLEETLIKPAQEFATNTVGSLFGIEGLKQKAIEDAIEQTGSGATDFGNKFMEIFNSLKSSALDFGSVVTSSFSSIFSSLKGIGSGGSGGGIFSSLFGGISSIFGGGASSTFMPASIAPDPGFASGGSVRKFAAGGMRDRVPSLLEPGEFVVRKQAAKVAGPSNLAALNATGQMGGGNVSVNVTNTGTPQEASASQPRFDGEKMVIDIVMRDLATNGPIRKSLRAGGAG
jgi:hypothetical protein